VVKYIINRVYKRHIWFRFSMTVSGIWLEVYIYIQAEQCFDEVYMGVDIDWNKRDICESRDNEIDVVVMKNSQPIFISCKMRPIEKETVYEIKSIGGVRESASYDRIERSHLWLLHIYILIPSIVY